MEEVLEEDSSASHLLKCFVGAKAGFEKILDVSLALSGLAVTSPADPPGHVVSQRASRS